MLAAQVCALATLGHGTAFAATPSFDCGAAQAPIEILICGDDTLAKADADLADLYRRLQSSLDGNARADFLSRQRVWLKSRFAACGIPTATGAKLSDSQKAGACLLALYRDRINELPVLAQNSQPGTPQASDQPVANPTVPVAAPVSESLPTALGLARTEFPATGEQDTILSIAQFGRYSVSVKSAQGVALQLVDRMTGPSEAQGEPGSADGRIDAFLDRGHYKILLHASEKGSGQAALSVHPFAELNGPDIPRLPEIKRIDAALDDYQQRSYWLEITQRRLVAIEVAGRNLADLRLWRDGNWLVDAAPIEAEIEPEAGKPLAVRRIVTTLEPGLYLLSAYGGPGETWAKTSDAHPLHLRMGIPIIADAGRQTFMASPFGIDRYLVPASANFFRLELPEAEAAEISVGDYKEETPFDLGDRSAISKKTLPPVAEISDASEDQGYKLVTVTREAGKPYILQHFQSVREYDFKGSGDYWLSTLHSGFGEDNVDATGVLTKAGIEYPERVIESNAPELATGAVWSRRFNLLEPVTVYFNVTEAGSYVVAGSGATAEYRFEPMIHLGIDYKAPEFQLSGYAWKLEPGYYILTGRPKNGGKGILTLRVADANAAPGAAPGTTPGGGDQAKETSVTFPKLQLDSDFRYALYLNDQPGVKAGAVLRRLPIDLQQGLPVTLKAGQSLDIPVTAPGGGIVTAIAEDAKPMAFTIDHG
ncbi:MAG TPA: lysozyme inhibitor LprI family protein, partial [Dongiaceae bacterium]